MDGWMDLRTDSVNNTLWIYMKHHVFREGLYCNSCYILDIYSQHYLIDVVQLGAGSAAIVRFLPEPLGANFDPAATGLAAAWPAGPLTELAVWGTGDDARLLDVSWIQTDSYETHIYETHRTEHCSRVRTGNWTEFRCGRMMDFWIVWGHWIS